VYCGPAIWPHDEDALENLAHYIIRAAFSQDPPASPTTRLKCDPERQRTLHRFSVAPGTALAGRAHELYNRRSISRWHRKGDLSIEKPVLDPIGERQNIQNFDALDWLAQLTTHIPGKNEQMFSCQLFNH